MKLRVLILCVLSAAVVVASPWLGEPLQGETGRFILENLRIPRVLMAVLVGGTMSLVGACYQTIFANALAAPSTVGTTAGATLGALVAVVLGPILGLGMTAGLPVTAAFAFIGALVVSLVIAAIAASGRARVNDILLAGIAISLAAGAISAGLQFTADQLQLYAAIQWSLGHLPQVGYRGVVMILPFVIVCWVVLLANTRGLQTLLGGEDRAHSQGVNVPWLRSMVWSDRLHRPDCAPYCAHGCWGKPARDAADVRGDGRRFPGRLRYPFQAGVARARPAGRRGNQRNRRPAAGLACCAPAPKIIHRIVNKGVTRYTA